MTIDDPGAIARNTLNYRIAVALWEAYRGGDPQFDNREWLDLSVNEQNRWKDEVPRFVDLLNRMHVKVVDTHPPPAHRVK